MTVEEDFEDYRLWVEENCVSKKSVKEALIKIRLENNNVMLPRLDMLEKELGLEE